MPIPSNRSLKSSRVAKCRRSSNQGNRLNFQRLEDRHLLAAITVSNNSDVVSATADTTSIVALIASDGGDGISLREAIAASNNTAGADTVTFDGSVFTGGAASLIRLTQGELDVTETLTIDAFAATDVTITGDKNGNDVTVAGSYITDVAASYTSSYSSTLRDNSRVINFSSSDGNLALSRLTVTGGSTFGDFGDGGGVLSNSGNVTLINSTVSGNNSYSDGGGVFTLSGNVSLTGSMIDGNRASSDGGGVYTDSGDISLVNSEVNGNVAERDSGGGISTESGDVSLTDSVAQGNIADRRGGAIATTSGTVSLTNSTVSGNSVEDDFSQHGGGGIYTSSGDVTLTNSTLSENRTEGSSGEGGGIRSLSGNVSLTHSTISGNGTQGSRSNGGGISTELGNVVLVSSTISGNFTEGELSEGGGISTRAGAISLTNSTVSGNRTAGYRQFGSDGTAGGGIWTDQASVLIVNSTVANNSATGVGGGISFDEFAPDSIERLTIINSIVADNSDDGTAPDLQAPGDAANNLVVEHSLIGNTFGSGVTATTGDGNILDQAALLKPLTDNGGPTLTHALSALSPAIDAANEALLVDQGIVLANDQRGTSFVRAFDDLNVSSGFDFTMDIGSFERQNVLLVDNRIDEDDGDFSEGDLSLREAIRIANQTFGENEIDFSGSVFTGGADSVIRLTQGELMISEGVSINGETGTDIVITGDAFGNDVTVAGSYVTDVDASLAASSNSLNDNSRVINFLGGFNTLTLSNLTITGGRTIGIGGGAGVYTSFGDILLTGSTLSGNSSGGNGGGISSFGGNVTLVDSTLSNNSTNGTTEYGGGISTFDGNVTVNNSTISENFASSKGGGIHTNSGDVLVVNSTIDGNGTVGPFAGGGGIFADQGNVEVTNSTVSSNSTSGEGADGGGIAVPFGSLSLINSTVSGNSVSGTDSNSGGIWSLDPTILIVNSTITNNSASGAGGGIGIPDTGVLIGEPDESLTIVNSIVTGNTDNGTAPDVLAPSLVVSNFEVRYSLIGDATGSGVSASNGNILNEPALLGPLADNGGPTLTHALLPGSPAIDAGSNFAAAELGVTLTSDQRGEFYFVRSFDDPDVPRNRVDIGSFERQTLNLVVDTLVDEDDGNFSTGDLSLREAIGIANDVAGEDTITFDDRLFEFPFDSLIRLTQGELVVTDGLTIEGPRFISGLVITADANGDDVTLPGGQITDIEASFGGIEGAEDDLLDDNSRVVNFTAATGNLTLSDITITGGRTTGDNILMFDPEQDTTYSGGGIRFGSSGTLTLDRIEVSGNSTSGERAAGGGIHTLSGDIVLTNVSIVGRNGTFGILSGGGGISNSTGNISLTNSFVSVNRTTGYAASGGGIYNGVGDTSLTNSRVNSNSTAGHAGYGGGIQSLSGNVSLTDSTVSGNSTAGNDALGGGINSYSGEVSLTNSTVSDNSTAGMAAHGGGIANASGFVSLTNSTLSGNSTIGSDSNGGGIVALASTSSITLTNSSLSGNSVTGSDSDGGGIWFLDSTVSIINSTIADNSATASGGGIYVLDDDALDTERLTLINSIVADNTDNGFAPDLSLPASFGNKLMVDYSLIGDTIGSNVTAASGIGNVLNQSAMLGPLADNGGPTLTHELLPGSPAIDAGSDGALVAAGVNLSTDQRGGVFFRSIDDPDAIGTGIDIGSFERRVFSLVVDNRVDEDDDDFSQGDLSLREAIRIANELPGNDTITFDEQVFSGGVDSVIRLTLGELEIAEEVTIDGSSGTDIVITGDANNDDVTLAGTFITDVNTAASLLDDNFRVISFTGRTGILTLSDLTLTGGFTRTSIEDGGGIETNSGNISLINSTVSGNSTEGQGGGIHTWDGHVSLSNSSVHGNKADGTFSDGGGIYTRSGDISLFGSSVTGNQASSDGGGIHTDSGSVSLTNSMVDGNSTTSFSGQGGGIRSWSGNIELTSSTVSGNSTLDSSAAGGGIYTRFGDVSLVTSTVHGNGTFGRSAVGGGIYVHSGDLSLTNSTVSGNSVNDHDVDGGGIWVDDSNVSIVNSTITGNSATGAGGGIAFSTPDSSVERLTIINSIIAGNVDDGTAPDVDAPDDLVNDLIVEHSLIGDTTGSGIDSSTGTGNILNQPALLGPLADNGGPTLTHALLAGSPAIDAGSDSLAVNQNGFPLVKDQRGFGRVVDGNNNGTATVDIGAYELGGTSPLQFPVIRSISRDEGGELARPDLLSTFSVSFDVDVSVDVDDLVIRNDTLGGTVVDSSGVTMVYDAATHTATWDFSSLILAPAFYSFELSSDIVSVEGSLNLDGDFDGTPGGNHVESIYVALPGDANLDGVVDVLSDAFALVGNLNSTTNLAWANGNFNGDDAIDVLGDAFVLVGNLGRDVRPPTAAAPFSTMKSLALPTSPSRSAVVATTLISSSDADDQDKTIDDASLASPLSQSPTLVLAGDHELRDDVFGSNF